MSKPTNRLTRLGIWLLTAILVTGCAPPLLEYELDTPATMLAPIGAAPVSEGRPRFREIFCALLSRSDPEERADPDCENHLLRLADEPAADQVPPRLPEHNPRLHVVLLPGAFSECFGSAAEPFREGAKKLEQLGYPVQTLELSGRSSSDHNGTLIAAAMEAIDPVPGGGIVLIGYSKGANDILSFLVSYPELAARVTAAVSVAGSVNGSPLADRYAGLYAFWFANMDYSACGPGDGGVVESIRRTTALSWLASHRLPEHIRYFSMGSFAESERIARGMRLTVGGRLSRVDPRNDGQTLYYDQLIPGSTLLGYANAGHWSVAIPLRESMPFFAGNASSSGEFPRSALLEAIMLFVSEQLEN